MKHQELKQNNFDIHNILQKSIMGRSSTTAPILLLDQKIEHS